MNVPFHISLPCQDIDATRKFYLDDLALEHGRNSSNWLDVKLFDHQLTFVLHNRLWMNNPSYHLDSSVLPMFHFGVILNQEQWEEMYDKVNYWMIDLEPSKTFFKDKLGEHHSFFIKDPNNYTIEFKSFHSYDDVFSY